MRALWLWAGAISRARHDELKRLDPAGRVVAGNEEMDPQLSEADDLLGRIDAAFGPFAVPYSFLLRGSSIHCKF